MLNMMNDTFGNRITPLQGFSSFCSGFHRALPYAVIDALSDANKLTFKPI